jgi:hypothetical protein
VKKVLSDLIRETFNEAFPRYTIQIEPLTQRRLLNMYLEQGAIKSITISSFNSPQRRIEERFANDDREIESLATYEFTIRSRRNRNLGLFQSILSRIANGSHRTIKLYQETQLSSLLLQFQEIKRELIKQLINYLKMDVM